VSNDDTTPTGTKVYARDKRAVMAGLATLLATASMGIGAWAHQKISDHDARLVHVEVQQTNDGHRQADSEARLDRMDSKLDRILERLPR
jgi:hypothetical protein